MGGSKNVTLTRREVLAGLAGFGAAACTAGLPGMGGGHSAPLADWSEADALGQAELVRSGQITALELTEGTIRRIEARDGGINAVTTHLFDRALEQAAGPLPEGPFTGVPFLLKDLNDLAGAPTTNGSRLFANFVPEESSPHTLRSLDAGLVILGKTNTPEFGLVATTEPLLLGPCHNPWNRAYSAGGSSGGAAAAVAAGMLPMAQASDGGGSIRVPASCCGVFGLKPSRGRNPRMGRDRGVDIAVRHVVSRSVRDSAAFLTVTQEHGEAAALAPVALVEGPAKRRLRIAFHTDNVYGSAADPQVAAALDATAVLCRNLGHEVVAARPDYQGEAFAEHFLDIWTSGAAQIVELARARGLDPNQVLEPVTLGMAQRYRARPKGSLERSVAFFREYERSIDAFFESHDVLLTPVLRRPPIPLGEQGGGLPLDRVMEPMLDYVSYTPVWNATGNPAMSVPLGWSDLGLPIGSQFVARLGREETLLALAYELEEAQPWAHHRPAISR